jgi:hypothetical protein
LNGSLAAGFSRMLLSLIFCTAGAEGFEELPVLSTTRTLVVTTGVRSRSEKESNEGVEGRDAFLSGAGATEGVLGRGILSIVLPIFRLEDGAGVTELEADVPLNGGGAGVLGGPRDSIDALPFSFFFSLSVSIARTSSRSRSSKGSESSIGAGSAGGGGGGGGGGEGAREGV